MAKWKVDLSKFDGLTSASGLANGTIFYGKKNGEYIDVDFSKPITKDGKDVNVSTITGIGSNLLSLQIKREYVKFVPTTAEIAICGTLLAGICAFAIYKFVKR